MKISFIGKIFLASAMVGFSACNNAPTVTPTSFETVTLTNQNIVVPVEWSATVVGKNDVYITPKTSGQLMEVCVSTGQRVKKGQKLFVIDQRQAKLAVNEAKADLLAAEAAESTAKLEYESNNNLFEKGIVSVYMRDAALNDYKRASAAVAQAKAAVENAQLNLEFCTVIAPVSGMVGVLPINQGVQVSPVDVLTTISGNDEMTAKFSLTETLVQEIIADYGSLEKALMDVPQVSLFLKDGTEYAHKGKIVSASGVVDQMTGSVECRANFPNPDGALYSGIQGKVQMPLAMEDVMVIPLTAIVRLQNKTLAHKVDEKGCAVTTVISIEEIGNGKDAVVTAGLNPGDVIVAKGAANVYDGQQVVFPESNTANK